MTDDQTSGLLSLPAELRLKVYQHLVNDCLTEGSTHDVAGLYLCCREIHTELETEHISKVRPLLEAEHRWEQAAHDVAPIRFEMNTKTAARKDGACLTIRIPILEERRQTNGYTHSGRRFCEMVESLRPVLGLSWSTLKLCFYDPAGGFRSFEDTDILYVYILNHLYQFAVPGTFALRQTDRLVLMHPHEADEDRSSESIPRTFFEDFAYVGRLSRGPNGFARASRGWCYTCPTTGEDAWHMVIDFKNDLEVPERALYSYYKVDRVYKSKRLSGNEAGEQTTGLEYEQMNDTESEETDETESEEADESESEVDT
jgi:hypothetical protein